MVYFTLCVTFDRTSKELIVLISMLTPRNPFSERFYFSCLQYASEINNNIQAGLLIRMVAM